MASIPVANAFGALTVTQIYAVALLSATMFVAQRRRDGRVGAHRS
jgi:hypothetical protein